MKKIDFDNDSIKKNILQAALPMLAAQILSLLYNIVDRIYIARIQDMGTTALGAVGLCFPIIMLTIAFSNLFGSGGAPLFSIKRGMSDDRAANTIMNTSFTMVCKGHHKPWNLRLCHAAHKQPGIYMLQQCAFSDRWRFVHIGNDHRIKHQADCRDSNLCNCGGFISCFKLQLWRQKAGPGEKIYFHYGTARASIYSCHVECDYTCPSCPDCNFQFRFHPYG